MAKPKLPFREYEWTPQLAYVVGLLATDGNLSKDGRHITMRSKDIDLMEMFLSCLGLRNKIGTTIIAPRDGHKGGQYYRVQFGSVQFYNWLVSIGITPAKSRTIGPVRIPNRYFRDFLRGHLDGDGTILLYQDTSNQYRGRTYTNLRIYLRFISASYEHIAWLRKTITNLTCAHGALLHHQPRTPHYATMWHLQFSKKEAKQLLNWIYYQPNLPCLKRKWMIAQEAFQLTSNERRRVWSRIPA